MRDHISDRRYFGVAPLATKLNELLNSDQIGPWHVGHWVDFKHTAVRIKFLTATDGEIHHGDRPWHGRPAITDSTSAGGHASWEVTAADELKRQPAWLTAASDEDQRSGRSRVRARRPPCR